MPESPQPDTPRATTLIGALLAPWLALMRPGAAARRMAAAPLWAMGTSYMIYALALASAVIVLALWAASFKLRLPSPESNVGVARVVRQPLGDVWREWHRESGFGLAERGFMLIVAAVVVLGVSVAWMHLSGVHRHGAAGPSFRKALSAVAACVVVLLAVTVGVGSVIVRTNHWIRFGSVGTGIPATIEPVFVAAVAFAAGACLLILVAGRAVRGLPGAPPAEVPPRCEGCGYELTHRPADGLCPECGRRDGGSFVSAESSAEHGLRRESGWERQRGAAGWLATTLAVLFEPSRFYGGLRMRIDDRAARAFAGWHCVLIGAGAMLWIQPVMWAGNFVGTATDRALFSTFVALAVLASAWITQRLVAATATSWWLQQGYFADLAWLRRVVAYETPFLWVFCACNGLLLTLAIASPRGVAPILFGMRFFWLRGPAVFVVLGNAVLGLLWLWRFTIAGRAIRWNNS